MLLPIVWQDIEKLSYLKIFKLTTQCSIRMTLKTISFDLIEGFVNKLKCESRCHILLLVKRKLSPIIIIKSETISLSIFDRSQ